MSSTALPPSGIASPRSDTRAIERDLGIDQERQTALHMLLPLVLVLAVSWFVVLTDRVRPETWLSPVSLIGAALLAYSYVGRNYAVAARLLLLGALFAIAWTTYISSTTPIVLALGPLVYVGMLLLGWRWGTGLTAAGTLVLLFVSSAPASGGLPWAALLLLWCSAWLSWVTLRPTDLLMHWAWQYLDQIEIHVEELRDSRAELTRTVASLNHAYDLLQRANYDLERARRAAEDARRLKAEFAANVSHELRTPLNLILGFSEVMVLSPQSYDTPLPATYRGDIEAIYRSARYLSNLVDDVLDLSGIEASRMALMLDEVDPEQVIAEALATVATLFEDRGLWLRADLPANLPVIMADRTRIRQVLINLLNNAVRFTAQGGVVVRTAVEERAITITVSDTGIGIPADKLDEVFDEFEQLGAITHRRYGGSGLGLAISKKFVELHGGRIWVESTVGKGTTFYVTLPFDRHSALAPSSGASSWASPGARHLSQQPLLLVCDDDLWTVRLLQRYLDGYRVLSADAAGTLDEPPQAIVVNVHDASGSWPQIEELRVQFPQIPIFVCALPTRRESQHVQEADDFLLKPVDRAHLLAAIDRLGRPVHSVLVVDDDPEFVQLITRTLGAPPRAYQVHQASSGAVGLELLRSARPDAVVLDLLLPDLDGYAVLHHIRTDPTLFDTPVIVVSARGYEPETIHAELLGVVQAAGFSVAELVAWLRTSLGVLAV